jgi:hypothetical protein
VAHNGAPQSQAMIISVAGDQVGQDVFGAAVTRVRKK